MENGHSLTLSVWVYHGVLSRLMIRSLGLALWSHQRKIINMMDTRQIDDTKTMPRRIEQTYYLACHHVDTQ